MTAHDTTTPGHTHVHADGTHHHPDTEPRTSGETRPIDGPVMLDIGGDIGAVIARLDDELDGTELPIRSLDDPTWDPNTHTGVWRRRLGNTTAVVAIYPQLPAGRYQITLPNTHTTDLTVTGGHINHLDLRTTSALI